MIYTVKEIQKRIAPIAEKYALNAVYLFGSYARNEADENSDIDFLIDRAGSSVRGMLDMSRLYQDLSRAVDREIDLLTMQALEQLDGKNERPLFVQSVMRERMKIYG